MRLPYVLDTRREPVFPDFLQPDETGLVAIGGDLSERTLVEAYSKGIFPWIVLPPILWYSPDPRLVLYPSRFHLSRRLARTLRQGRFRVRLDADFDEVIRGCAQAPRRHEEGTWIDRHMIAAYTALYHRRIAHCAAVYRDGLLCGGLYGLSLGRVFFGESMFALQPDASKVALYTLSRWLEERNFAFVDCQVRTGHLVRLGAVEIPRRRFLRELREALGRPGLQHRWRLEKEG